MCLIHLKGRLSDEDTQSSSICWVISQMVEIARAGPDHSQERLWLSHKAAEAQVLGPSSSAFAGSLAGSWIRNRAGGTRTGAHIGCQCYRLRLNPLYHNTSHKILYNYSN